MAQPLEHGRRSQTLQVQSLWYSASAVEGAVEAVLADREADERLLSLVLVSVVRAQSQNAQKRSVNAVDEFASVLIPSVVREQERGERRWVSA